MKPTELQLRRTSGSQRGRAAVLLAEGDASTWLHDLAAAKGALAELELYRLPGAGLIAIGAVETPGLGLGWLGQRLLLPLDAEVDPPLSGDEADRLFAPWPLVVWLPAFGPRGFERSDRWTLGELLAVPRDRREGTWNAAEPGDPPRPSLRMIQLPLPVQASELFGEAARQIGSEPIQPPPGSERKPAGPQPEPGGGALGSFLRGLGGLLGAAGGQGAGWMRSVEGWLERRLGSAAGGASRVPDDLNARRQREIDRLLRELTENPDRGLRHAIPLGSLAGAEPRGVAPPSWQLGLRQTDFALDALFVSRAADDWNLDAQRQNLLRQRYHELARRELQLGRHRRAAYIYAQLLRDLHSAAATLLAGGHHREAAVLYLDHLRNPPQAARALLAGGFYEEALPVLESIADWRGVAQVQRLRGDESAARAALRKEAARLIGQGSRVAGAAVLENEVEAPREAAEALAGGWPEGALALECLCELFALHLRQRWNEEAGALLTQLREQALTGPQNALLAKALARVHTRLPSAPWRSQAAEVAYARIGRGLAGSDESERRTLLDCLPKLAAGDRLVGRDVQRFLGFPRELSKHKYVEGTRGEWRLEEIKTVRPNAPFELLAAAPTRDGYVLVGHQGTGDLGARLVTWNGEANFVSWPGVGLEDPPLIAASLEHRCAIFLIPRADGDKFQPPMLRFPNSPVSIGWAPWLPADVWEATYVGPYVASTRGLPQPTLSLQTVTGALSGTLPLPKIEWRHSNATHLAGHPGGYLAFAADETLALLERVGSQAIVAAQPPQVLATFDLASRVCCLRASHRSARAGFVATTEAAAWLWWYGRKELVHVAETREAGSYRAAFTGSNCLLLVDDLGGQMYEIDLHGDPTLRAEFPLPPGLEISPGPVWDDFAIYQRDGTVSVFRACR